MIFVDVAAIEAGNAVMGVGEGLEEEEREDTAADRAVEVMAETAWEDVVVSRVAVALSTWRVSTAQRKTV